MQLSVIGQNGSPGRDKRPLVSVLQVPGLAPSVLQLRMQSEPRILSIAHNKLSRTTSLHHSMNSSIWLDFGFMIKMPPRHDSLLVEVTVEMLQS